MLGIKGEKTGLVHRPLTLLVQALRTKRGQPDRQQGVRGAHLIVMEELDKRPLDHVQGEFPMMVRPFAVVGAAPGIPEDEALTRTRRMKEAGSLWQVSAIFDTRALGHQLDQRDLAHLPAPAGSGAARQ